jgi:hypothetical protein
MASVGVALAGGALAWAGGGHLLASTAGAARSASELLAVTHNTSAGVGTLAGLLGP